jgi:hypothetical protein
MQLTIDTENLSTLDRSILQQILGGESSAPAPAKPAKTAAKPTPTPDPEPAETGDDVVGDDAPTKEQAVARAMELVGEGKAAEVKAALSVVGAKRVSELKSAADVAKFFAALDV